MFSHLRLRHVSLTAGSCTLTNAGRVEVLKSTFLVLKKSTFLDSETGLSSTGFTGGGKILKSLTATWSREFIPEPESGTITEMRIRTAQFPAFPAWRSRTRPAFFVNADRFQESRTEHLFALLDWTALHWTLPGFTSLYRDKLHWASRNLALLNVA